jgi:hypothetical protein
MSIRCAFGVRIVNAVMGGNGGMSDSRRAGRG